MDFNGVTAVSTFIIDNIRLQYYHFILRRRKLLTHTFVRVLRGHVLGTEMQKDLTMPEAGVVKGSEEMAC